MFERFTEKARRVIFFARYEASQFGSPYIETEHLLLGLLREDRALTGRFLKAPHTPEAIRETIEEHTIVRDKVSTSVDLPLSNESKRVLGYMAEEAERLGHKYIGTEHLLLGLLREEKSFAAVILQECGLREKDVREAVGGLSDDWRRVQQHRERLPEVHFVNESGQILFKLRGTQGLMLPRSGEYVTFPDDQNKAEYQVERVTYEFERVGFATPPESSRLLKVEIMLTPVSGKAEKT